MNKITLKREDIKFENFINTIAPTILTWKDVGILTAPKYIEDDIKEGLLSLNELFKCTEETIEDEFIKIVEINPKSRLALLGLVTLDVYGGTHIIGLEDYINLTNSSLFSCEKLFSERELKELKYFFSGSGLKDLILSENINCLLTAYLCLKNGVYASNKRKNSSGSAMELKCEEIISNYCKDNDCIYIKQADKKTIEDVFGITFNIENKRYDFAICDKNKKLHLVEVNIYLTGGSKLKTTCGDFIKYNEQIKSLGHNFLWITDGNGWLTCKNPMKEAYEKIENIVNFNMIEQGALNLILNT